MDKPKKGLTEVMIGIGNAGKKGMREDDGDMEPDEGDDAPKVDCAREMIAAVKRNDAQGMVEAMETFFNLMEREPHEEADHEGY